MGLRADFLAGYTQLSAVYPQGFQLEMNNPLSKVVKSP